MIIVCSIVCLQDIIDIFSELMSGRRFQQIMKYSTTPLQRQRAYASKSGGQVVQGPIGIQLDCRTLALFV